MSPSEFFRPRALPVLGPGIAILLLAACQTTPAPEMAPAPEPVAEPAPQPSIARPAAPVTPVPAPQPVPATSLAADLIGQPPSALEALTGAPALTRTELAGEFRRYDLGACRSQLRAIGKVGRNAPVRKQSRVLENVTRAAPFGRQVHPGGAVEQDISGNHDPPRLGSQQPGDGIERAGLAHT